MNSIAPRARTATARITPRQAVTLAANGDLCLIDVRDISEIRATGKASGALHIPLTMLAMQADPRSPDCAAELDVATPVGIYCATGARSGMAAQMLAVMGYQSVHNLGGLSDWAAAGGAIQR